MRLIPAAKGAAVDRFGDKPPPDKFDPSSYLQQPEGGRVGSMRDER